MKHLETLSWTKVSKYLDQQSPALLSVGGSRGLQLGFEPQTSRLFMRIPLAMDAIVPASPFSELVLEQRYVNDSMVMEVSTASRDLYREFHHLAGLFAEELEESEAGPVAVFFKVAARWKALTAGKNLLSSDAQLGLIGELTVLMALIRRYGPEAVRSWTAWADGAPGRHDFRVGCLDLEVKSTRGATRSHFIHGLHQLEPAVGHALFLFSLKYESAGLESGFSLVSRIESVREALSNTDEIAGLFEKKLQAMGYRDVDAGSYESRVILSDDPLVVPVDKHCPRLISTDIADMVGQELAHRIGNDVVYRIDVEGLGYSLDQSDQLGELAGLTIE